MLVVKIELHSAITGKITEIGRTYIWNDGTVARNDRGNYGVAVCKKGRFTWPLTNALRTGAVKDYPRLSYNVWRLIIRALLSAFPEEKAK